MRSIDKFYNQFSLNEMCLAKWQSIVFHSVRISGAIGGQLLQFYDRKLNIVVDSTDKTRKKNIKQYGPVFGKEPSYRLECNNDMTPFGIFKEFGHEDETTLEYHYLIPLPKPTNGLFGFLCLRFNQHAPISPFGLSLLEDMLDLLKLEIVQQIEHQYFENAALRDPLTEAWNRRGFLKAASDKISMSSGTDYSLVIFAIDLNGLKKINDQYGHQAGDQAIISVYQEILKALRVDDVIARIGGDEFLAIAEIKHFGDICVLTQRILSRMAAINLSISIGSVEVTDENTPLDEYINIADSRMYSQKFGLFDEVALTT